MAPKDPTKPKRVKKEKQLEPVVEEKSLETEEILKAEEKEEDEPDDILFTILLHHLLALVNDLMKIKQLMNLKK